MDELQLFLCARRLSSLKMKNWENYVMDLIEKLEKSMFTQNLSRCFSTQ